MAAKLPGQKSPVGQYRSPGSDRSEVLRAYMHVADVRCCKCTEHHCSDPAGTLVQLSLQ